MFYVRADLLIGSYSVTKDLGSNAQRDYIVEVDFEELSGTTGHVQVYAREGETDGWGQPLTGVASEAVDTNAYLQIQGTFRYVKVDVVTTGDVFESGVVGY